MLLIDELTQSGINVTLYGVRRILERQFRLKNVLYLFNNNLKNPLQRKKDWLYPYSYLTLNSLRIVKDQHNNKAVQRHGMSDRQTGFTSQNNATNATINKFFLFPAELQMELHYFHDNVPEIIKFVEAFLILGGNSSLSFFIKLDDSAQWLARIELQDDSISVPVYDLEDPVSPGAMEITIALTIHTKMGFVRDVAKVNAEPQTMTFMTGTSTSETEIIPKALNIVDPTNVALNIQGF